MQLAFVLFDRGVFRDFDRWRILFLIRNEQNLKKLFTSVKTTFSPMPDRLPFYNWKVSSRVS